MAKFCVNCGKELNEEDNAINLVYKKKNKEYGLIEPEV